MKTYGQPSNRGHRPKAVALTSLLLVCWLLAVLATDPSSDLHQVLARLVEGVSS